MNTKKKVLFVGLGGTLLILALFSLGINGCNTSVWCNKIIYFVDNGLVGDVINSDTFLLIFLTIPLFILSLITYKMHDEVFRAWWRFARWWVPVIMIVTFLLENAGGGGGWGMNGGAFDAFFIGIFYVIFIVISLVKIFNAYFKTKEI